MNEDTSSKQQLKLDSQEYRDWLKVMYQEAWRQYSHEDTMYQMRFNSFLNVQAALVAFLALTAGIVTGSLRIDLTIGFVALNIFACLGIFICIIGLCLTYPLKTIAEGERAYGSLRGSNAWAIERELELTELGLASAEHRWHDQSKLYNEKYCFPERNEEKSRRLIFSANTVNRDLAVRLRPRTGPWDASFALIQLIRAFWLGILLFLLGMLIITPKPPIGLQLLSPTQPVSAGIQTEGITNFEPAVTQAQDTLSPSITEMPHSSTDVAGTASDDASQIEPS